MVCPCPFESLVLLALSLDAVDDVQLSEEPRDSFAQWLPQLPLPTHGIGSNFSILLAILVVSLQKTKKKVILMGGKQFFIVFSLVCFRVLFCFLYWWGGAGCSTCCGVPWQKHRAQKTV